MSKGEDQVAYLLHQANINFQREKSFQDLKCGLFRFDFYIEDYRGRRAVIEFNGAQHYEYISAFYKTQADWNKAREHDRRKISYCLANDIDIYIIPYWDAEQLVTAEDLFQSMYRARSRWHNDNVKKRE